MKKLISLVNEIRLSLNAKMFLILTAVVVLVAAAPAFDVSNMDGLHLQGSFGTATPSLLVDQQGTGKILELRDNATPVFSVNDGGAVSGMVLSYSTTGKELVCGTGSISTGTSISHGLSTPEAVICSLNEAITGDGAGCSSVNASGVVTITVYNSAATPAAAAAAHSVGYCILGTP